MRIDSSTISMAATRSYKAETEATQTSIIRGYGADGKLEQAQVTKATTRAATAELTGSAAVYTTSGDGLSLASQGESHSADSETKPGNVENAARPASVPAALPDNGDWLGDIASEIENDPKIQMLRKMLELLEQCTGKKCSSRRLDTCPSVKAAGAAFQVRASAASMRYQQAMVLFGGGPGAARPNAEGAVNGHWTRQVIQSGFVAGEEHTAFTSSGSVVTSDGRTISFGISMEMSRSFAAAYVSAGKEEIYTDPLVINLDTDAASLSDVSFYFDLNCDGKADELAGLGAGSGFLALDKNGDGVINDGSELFGARTGDGFGELAQYDQDGNGWIDENDSVFSKLSVWVRAGSGTPRLLSLAEAGVGAIFLGSHSTEHGLSSGGGSVDARVRRTGLYLKESGQAGTVQHIDFKA